VRKETRDIIRSTYIKFDHSREYNIYHRLQVTSQVKTKQLWEWTREEEGVYSTMGKTTVSNIFIRQIHIIQMYII